MQFLVVRCNLSPVCIGKRFGSKKIKSDFKFCQQARVFSQVGQAKQDIIVTGERALVSLYGGTSDFVKSQ